MGAGAPPAVSPLHGALVAARDFRQLGTLPASVRGFYVRAIAAALRLRDWRTLNSSAQPRDVASLLDAFAGRERVVEIGTASAWTAAALALAEPARSVLSLDPEIRQWRHRYVALVPLETQARLTLEQASGADRPQRTEPVDALFVDAGKRAEQVRAYFESWEPLLAPGAVVAFHDFGHPGFPGIAQAVRELGLEGRTGKTLFFWRKP